jgi:hypothetical protein
LLGNVQNGAKHSIVAAGTSRIDYSHAVRWEAWLDPPLGSTDIGRLNGPLCIQHAGRAVCQDLCDEFHEKIVLHPWNDIFARNGMGRPG